MNELIKNILDQTQVNVVKTHQLLEEVLNVVSRHFPEKEIHFNPNAGYFILELDNNNNIMITKDLNKSSIVTGVVNPEGMVAAECALDVNGKFDERYGKIENKEFKLDITSLFSDISYDIDLKKITGVELTPEENVSEAPSIEPVEEETETPVLDESEVEKISED